MISLYLHIPFCIKKCDYCDFYSIVNGTSLFNDYVWALRQELCSLVDTIKNRQLKSLFIGGGTPTTLPPEMLQGLVGYCLELFQTVEDTEISVEVNPGTVNGEYFSSLFAAGVNRISIGAQSFNKQELQNLGRIHNREQIILAVQQAVRAGFSNINIDLMYGLPGQTLSSWGNTLFEAIALQPKHLSLYQLTIEEETPLYQAVANQTISLPDDNLIEQLDVLTEAVCTRNNYQQYEISNYSQPGYECRHNITYWENENYYACGASAVSYCNGVREKRIDDPAKYIELTKSGKSVIEEREILSVDAAFRETVVMGLRMVQGVSLQKLRNRFGNDLCTYYGTTLKKLIDAKLLTLDASFLRLTPKGRLLANMVMAELV